MPATAPLVSTLSSTSASPAALATMLDAFLQGLGPVAIVSCQVQVRASERHASTEVLLVYNKPGNLLYRAEVFVGADIDASVNAFLALAPNRRPVFFRDLRADFTRLTDTGRALLVYTDSVVPANRGASRAVLLRAVGAIAPGAGGAARLLCATGIEANTPAVSVVNLGQVAWADGGDAYGVLDSSDAATFLCFPTCCNVV
jgi:hypothetical protein